MIPLREEEEDSRERERHGILDWFGLEKTSNPIQSHPLEHQKSTFPCTPSLRSRSILTSFCFPPLPAPLFQAPAPPPPGACKTRPKIPIKSQEIPRNPNRARQRSASRSCSGISPRPLRLRSRSREFATNGKLGIVFSMTEVRAGLIPKDARLVPSHSELLQGIRDTTNSRFPNDFSRRIFQPVTRR